MKDIDAKIQELIKKNINDINANDYEKVIVETYLNLGAKGVNDLKQIFIESDLDMKFYDKSIAKIINGILGVE